METPYIKAYLVLHNLLVDDMVALDLMVRDRRRGGGPGFGPDFFGMRELRRELDPFLERLKAEHERLHDAVRDGIERVARQARQGPPSPVALELDRALQSGATEETGKALMEAYVQELQDEYNKALERHGSRPLPEELHHAAAALHRRARSYLNRHDPTGRFLEHAHRQGQEQVARNLAANGDEEGRAGE